jgi:hypothetical protein
MRTFLQSLRGVTRTGHLQPHLIYLAIAVGCLGLISYAGLFRSQEPSRSHTVFLTGDGKPLAGLFYGLKADARFSLQAMKTHQNVAACRQTKTWRTRLGRYLDTKLGIATVHAQDECVPSGNCGGRYYCATEDYCDQGLCGGSSIADETYYSPPYCDCYGFQQACDCGTVSGLCANYPQCFSCALP